MLTDCAYVVAVSGWTHKESRPAAEEPGTRCARTLWVKGLGSREALREEIRSFLASYSRDRAVSVEGGRVSATAVLAQCQPGGLRMATPAETAEWFRGERELTVSETRLEAFGEGMRPIVGDELAELAGL